MTKIKQITIISFISTLLIFIPSLSYSQSETGINTHLSFMWRDAQVLEATGVENTFLIYSNIHLFHYTELNSWAKLNFDLKLSLHQEYSYKSRYKEFFNINPFNLQLGIINIKLPYTNISLGKNYSPDNDLKGEQLIPPFVRTTPDFSLFPSSNQENNIYYNILSSKPRDIPIIYDSAPFNLYDTGISVKFNLFQFYLNLWILNGEEGLDSNSNKYYAISFGYNNETILIDLFMGIGKTGSVPYKAYAHKLKLNSIININNIELNSMISIFLMGLTHPKLNVFDAEMINDFGIDGLPFEPSDIPNLHNPGEPLYAYGYYLQMKYNYNIISFRLNFSLMDADYRYDDYEIYKIKWRIFGDIGLNLIKDLNIKLGASYTYNPVFLLGNQLYHLWEETHIGPVDYRLNYILIFVTFQYNFSLTK